MKGQAFNFRAMQWAWEQELPTREKIVLIEFAKHADAKGYTWPSLSHIAFTWSMKRDTVRRCTASLLEKQKLRFTKKRFEETGQVRVYRMPKPTWQSDPLRGHFKKQASDRKATHKWPISDPLQRQEQGIMNNEQHQKKISDAKNTLGNSLAGLADQVIEASSVFFGKNHQHQYDPRQYPEKWQDFCAWCYKIDPVNCKPTYQGFRTWMAKQTPYWRNHTKAVSEDFTYTLNGKSYTSSQASRMMLDDSSLFYKFKRCRPPNNHRPSEYKRMAQANEVGTRQKNNEEKPTRPEAMEI